MNKVGFVGIRLRTDATRWISPNRPLRARELLQEEAPISEIGRQNSMRRLRRTMNPLLIPREAQLPGAHVPF